MGGHLPGTLMKRRRKFGRWVSLILGARWGTCVVIDCVFGGLQIGATLSVGALFRGAPFRELGRIWEEGSGNGLTT